MSRYVGLYFLNSFETTRTCIRYKVLTRKPRNKLRLVQVL